jgi:hypothetical protein
MQAVLAITQSKKPDLQNFPPFLQQEEVGEYGWLSNTARQSLLYIAVLAPLFLHLLGSTVIICVSLLGMP